jgi:L-glyceraldehyde 3-phosphate reductase
MALAWVLKDKRITSVLIGASSVKQIDDNVESLKNLFFSDEELNLIEDVLK